MAALIARWGGDGLLRSLEQNYDTYRVFGASALGAEPDYRAGVINARGRLPHRVAEPFLWLLAERGFLRKQSTHFNSPSSAEGPDHVTTTVSFPESLGLNDLGWWC